MNSNLQANQVSENSFVMKAIVYFEQREIYYVGLFIVFILLHALHVPLMDIVISIAGSLLSVIYFFSGFRYLPTEWLNKDTLFIVKLGGVSAAVSLVGIMFAASGWPGAGQMLLGGLSSSVVCWLFCLYHIRRVTDDGLQKIFKRFIYRSVFFAGVCALFYFTPKETLQELGFKVHEQKKQGESDSGENDPGVQH